VQCQHAHPGIAEDCVNLTCRKESRESVGISKLTSSRQFRHHSNVTGFPNYRNSYFTRQQGLESTFLFRIHPHDYLKSLNIFGGKNPAGCIEYKPTLPFERHNRIYTSRDVLRLIETVGFKVIACSTGPSKKVRAVAGILESSGIAAKGFKQYSGGQTVVLASKTKHCDSLLDHEMETRWPSWLYSPRHELCVRSKQFIESDDV